MRKNFFPKFFEKKVFHRTVQFSTAQDTVSINTYLSINLIVQFKTQTNY